MHSGFSGVRSSDSRLIVSVCAGQTDRQSPEIRNDNLQFTVRISKTMKTRKEIKEEYKQLKFSSGIFQVKNISNNKVFIDNSPDMLAKWNRHKTELRFGTHKNRELQNDWNERGEENFVFEILSELKPNDKKEVSTPRELKLLQQMVIDELNIPEKLRY